MRGLFPDLGRLATLCCLVLVSIGAARAGAQAQDRVKPHNRSQATAIIRDIRQIRTPDGIERLEKVKIGGIDQWVSVRGRDPDNPVLLYIHGGPGYVSMPMSWWTTQGWDEYFTVVQWDQRAAGKTHLLTDPAEIGPTLTRERFVQDTEEMAAWARREFHKKRVFVLGHSWGSYLGLELAKRRPDWIYAYIGVGQLIDGPANERIGWEFAMKAAREAGHQTAIRELESIAPYPPPGRPVPLDRLYLQRKWVGYFGGVMAYRQGSGADSALARLSPSYSDEEIMRIWEGNEFAASYILPELLTLDLTDTRKLDFPVILFLGRHDRNGVSEVAADWLNTVDAPFKKVVWFEDSAHMPMTEEPGKFLFSLVQTVRPLATSRDRD